jgi:LIVCS family branched-chain amino acid:cation transporter
MMDRRKNLSKGELLIMGATIFSMHFGSSSMIWPMTWGKESGSSLFFAFMGIYLTAIFIPLLGYMALARGQGTFYQITERISKPFAQVFCSITILLLGPLFCIPRMSAALWDAVKQLFGYEPSSFLPGLIFSTVIFVVAYWFMAQKAKTIEKLSKILLPILLISIVFIIGKGLLFPISSWVPKTYSQPAFTYGFTEGYATLELPSALVIATIMINTLKERDIKGNSLNKQLFTIGFIGMSLLTVVHFCHMVLGSFTGNMFPNLKYSALYAQVVMSLWGNVGGLNFTLTLFCAVLCSTIGLTTATAEYFEEVLKDKISHSKIVIIILAASALLSTFGLKNIILFTSPLLNMIYPAAITITLYYALVPNLINKSRLFNAMCISAEVAFGYGIFDAVINILKMLNINLSVLEEIYGFFPFSQYGLGWVTLSLVGSIIGLTMKTQIVRNNVESVEV